MKLRIFFGVVLAVGVTLLWDYSRTVEVQRGYRGTGATLMYRPSTVAAQETNNKYPKPLRAARLDSPKASDSYENVQVLGDLTQAQMVRLMLSIKSWVAPQEGCNYCHNAPDYASDVKYPKRVARVMLRMTRHINSTWTQHVAAGAPTGVTCFTCHRGQPVPAKTWYAAPPPSELHTGFFNRRSGVRPPTPAAANTNLAPDAMSEFLLEDNNVRLIGDAPLAGENPHYVRNARETYSLMMVISESLGVNCNFCHATRAFNNWDQSSPQRATAWYGIRMVRDLNNNYVAGLNTLLPAERLGPTGDSPKVYCATCHQGSNKPLGGAPMLEFYPELLEPKSQDQATAPATPSAAQTLPPASAPAATPTATQTAMKSG